MSPLTRNWLIGMVLGWASLVYGWHTHNLWAVGFGAVLFLVMTIERFDNWSRGRK